MSMILQCGFLNNQGDKIVMNAPTQINLVAKYFENSDVRISPFGKLPATEHGTSRAGMKLGG